jgi:NADPH-dependent 2,4-dienoyl-CoA reductase/sulfur reductase-like enzyme/nitrite reductase/ring-hydroxylating ferredoxin subunit
VEQSLRRETAARLHLLISISSIRDDRSNTKIPVKIVGEAYFLLVVRIDPDEASSPTILLRINLLIVAGPLMEKLEGPDFTRGIELSSVQDGKMLRGHAGSEPVLLVRRGDQFFAVGALCTHYEAPLNEGLLVGEEIRCPWHHACFNFRTGEVLRAPALDALPRWRVEVVPDSVRESTGKRLPSKIYVREKLIAEPQEVRPTLPSTPKAVVIIGGGVAGNMAAETLRHEGYKGTITVLSADESLPCDRPMLSKGYLAGNSSSESTLLRSLEFYREQRIDLRLNSEVVTLNPAARLVELMNGDRLEYDALLLATGADPIRLEVPGSNLPHVYYLRSLSDSRALVSKAGASSRVVVIGTSFIGLEVAASLRARNLDVAAVAPEKIPMETLLGAPVGTYIRKLHEQHGVRFHLETTAISIDTRSVTLQNGTRLEADMVVVGIGVRPALSLAQSAGIATDRGIVVNQYLETSVPGIFAAGDIASWLDPFSCERIRVEHYVLAGRQGQTAARNILGRKEIFDAVPFFWTVQYDLGVGYIGHAEKWDSLEIEGNLQERDCSISYWCDRRKVAVAIINRNLEGLIAELDFERSAKTDQSWRSQKVRQ